MKILRIALALLLLASPAYAQGIGQLGSGQLWGNSTAARAPAAPTTVTGIIDRAISSTQGAVLTRQGSAWVGLAPGTVGLPLLSGGAAANVAYAILGLSAGGTNANLTASNGGLFYSTATAGAILAGTATAGQIPRSGASAAPSWSTATYPATAAAGTVLAAATANTVAATATPTLGIPGATLGTLSFGGNTSGTVLLTPQAAAGTPTLTFPNTSGTFAAGATSPLVLDASTGVLTCATCVTSSGGGAISGTAPVAVSGAGVVSITGAAGQVLAGASPAFTATPTLGVAGSTVGTLAFANATSGGVTLSPVTGALGTQTILLPAASGTVAVSATAPITLSAAGAVGVTGSALTRTDDTNVTLTLGGAPTTALLTATSLTLGWTGQLAVARGGTALSAGTSGGILGYTATGTLASSAALGANGVVIGGGAGATPTAISAGTNGQLLLGVTGSAPAMATMGTDATITNAGALTIANNAVTNAKMATAADSTIKSNISGGVANVSDNTITAVLDKQFGTTQGTVIYRNATVWAALTPGTNGQFLTTGGAAANVSWTAGGAGTGTVTSVVCGGLTITAAGTCPEPFDIQNISLTASVASNLLTVALKDAAGSDCSASTVCRIPFRNATAATGATEFVSVTAALSINTNATGATLASANATAFRFWVVAFNNAGTVVLALFNASTATQCYPINEGVVQSSTAISGSATSAGVYYTPNGTTVSAKAIKILGYVEYDLNGLTTAGTYASAPDFINTFGPGIKKPCDAVQRVSVSYATQESTTSATFVASTGARVPITPTSAANLVRVQMVGGSFSTPTLNVTSQFRMSRGTTANTNMIGSQMRGYSNAGVVQGPVTSFVWDKPNVISATTYTMQFSSDGTNATLLMAGNDTIFMEAVEIQG